VADLRSPDRQVSQGRRGAMSHSGGDHVAHHGVDDILATIHILIISMGCRSCCLVRSETTCPRSWARSHCLAGSIEVELRGLLFGSPFTPDRRRLPMSDVIGMSADDKLRRRRALAEALVRSREAEKAIIAHDRHEDEDTTERLTQALSSR
jgi:hypothetical protein